MFQQSGKRLLLFLFTLNLVLAGTPVGTAADSNPAAGAAQAGAIDVFVSGQEGFHTYRIPSIIRAANSNLIAMAEARQHRGDQASNQLVFKVSRDGGHSWNAPGFMARSEGGSLNNPCAVLVRETGELLVVYQSYPKGIAERSPELQTGLDGPRIVRSWLVRSRDHGLSWSQPEDITRQVKRADGVTTMASGPGIGIQLQRGANAGRLLIPFNEGPYGSWNVYAAYSDDRGTTWKQGGRVPGGMAKRPNGKMESTINEAQLVELSDGSVLLNMRSWGAPKLRKSSISRDAGSTWSAVESVADLPEPSCQSAILGLHNPAGKTGKPLLVYSGPLGEERRNGWLMVSRDDGASWKKQAQVESGRFAYSALVELGPGLVGCLFETGEKDPYERIRLKLIRVE